MVSLVKVAAAVLFVVEVMRLIVVVVMVVLLLLFSVVVPLLLVVVVVVDSDGIGCRGGSVSGKPCTMVVMAVMVPADDFLWSILAGDAMFR